MKYWKEERWQRATKSNVPHLYLYTWIRVSLWFTMVVNSILMFFIIKENSILDEMIPREDLFCVFMAVCGLIAISLPFDSRKSFRTLKHVVLDILEICVISIVYILGNKYIIFAYFLELIVIIYISIKIDKDNRVVDNNKVVLWWKHKKKEKLDREVQKVVERNINNSIKIDKTEEEKLKSMSRKQRKRYKNK